MATQSVQFYSNADGSTASLVYDDVAMTASGVQIHVPAGARTVTVNAVISGQPVNEVYSAGPDAFYSFASPLPIALLTTSKGTTGFSLTWLSSVCVSVNG